MANERKSKQEIFEKLNTSDMQKLTQEKDEIKSQIDILQQEKNNILLQNREIQVRQEQIKDAKNNIELLEKTQQEILDSIEKNKKQKEIANKLKRLVIEKQKEIIDNFLNKVDIQFSKINKSNDKISECREYKKLSKSQQARACLEISNLFNNLSGIKAPVFFDDGESTTDIQEMINTQMVISLVIKYNPLEILYDYSDVLDWKKKSIEREVEENSSFVVQQAA